MRGRNEILGKHVDDAAAGLSISAIRKNEIDTMTGESTK